ncbi:MAG: hypothetical protein ING25_10880 [Burkholderiales bacterium]|nr:hypothetical protein [Burkholderiales bacterium]
MTDATNTASAKPVLTKDEKIAAIVAQIAKLELRKYNLENDIAEPARAKKAVVLPEVGATVSFVYGRKTATTEPKTITGTVVAVKPATVDGEKKLPAQVKVAYGEGFDAAFAVVYPAQLIVINGEQQEQDDEQPQSVTDLYNGTAE